jgi:phosphate transport system substrate-binding protein
LRWFLVIILAAVALVVLSFALGGKKAGAVKVLGSTSVLPFAEMEAEEYEKSYPDRRVAVEGGGSTAGLQAAADGFADIGTCSRELSDQEKQQTFKVMTTAPDGSVTETEVRYQTTVIARDGLAVVVHPSNPINDLTLDQIRLIFAGDITNWREVGGPDAPIRPITREDGSGTREAFQKLIMRKTRIWSRALTQESNGSVKELVKNDPYGIGYMSLGLVGGELKSLKISGATPTAAEVAAGRYTLVRPFNFVTRGPPGPRAQAFIDFVMSPKGQDLLKTEGLVEAGEERKDH